MINAEELKNILFLDIETVSCVPHYQGLNDRLKPLWDKKARYLKTEENISEEDLFFQKAGIFAEFGKIVTIAVGFYHIIDNQEISLRVKSFANDNETNILKEFKNLVEKYDQTKIVLCAHNGKEFDYPYICRRMLVNCIPIPLSMDYAGKKPWEIKHLDTLEMWKFGDRKNYTSLDLLAAIFDIESSKSDLDGSMVNHAYYNDNNLNKIAIYCMHDVVVTAQLFLRYQCMPIVKPENITYL